MVFVKLFYLIRQKLTANNQLKTNVRNYILQCFLRFVQPQLLGGWYCAPFKSC